MYKYNRLTNTSDNFSSIDIAKFFASLIVIIIHLKEFISNDQESYLFFITMISKLAVPFFFICSGYFFFKKCEWNNGKIINSKSNRKKLFNYLKRICILYIIYSVVYLFYLIPFWYNTSGISIHTFIDYGVAFFRSGSVYHLWYIHNLIYATLLGYFLLSLINKRAVLFISIMFYTVGVFAYSYFWIDCFPIDLALRFQIFAQGMWSVGTVAFPIMFIGIIAGKRHRFSCQLNLFLFAISFVLLIAEYLFVKVHTKESFSYLFCTVPCTYFLFSSIVSINTKFSVEKMRLLRQMSTIIYCIHPMVIYIIKATTTFGEGDIAVVYTIVALSSILISYIIVKLSSIKLLRWLKYAY